MRDVYRFLRKVSAVVIGISLCIVGGILLYRSLAFPTLCDGCNVVLISLDAIPARAVFPTNGKESILPLLSKRAGASGVVFENAYSPTTQGWIGTASLLTGEYPWDMGIWSERSGIPRSVPTLAETLTTYSYDTAGFTLNIFVDSPWGFARGFSTWFHNSYSKGPAPAFQKAREWFSARDSVHPFLLFVQPTDIYSWSNNSTSSYSYTNTVPAYHGDTEALQNIQNGYRGIMRELDAELDTLIEEIYAENPNTIIVVTGSYGDEFLEKPERGIGKGVFPHEQVLHVPLIFFIPGVPASSVSATVEMRRVAPTLQALVGAKVTQKQNATLLPYIQGKNTTNQTAYAYVEASEVPYIPESPELLSSNLQRIRTNAIAIPENVGDIPPPATDTMRSLIWGPWHALISSNGKKFLFNFASDRFETRDVQDTVRSLGWEQRDQVGRLWSAVLDLQ